MQVQIQMFKLFQNLKFIKITATIAFTAAASHAWADMGQARQAFLQKQYGQALQLAVAAQAEAPYDASLLIARVLLDVGQPQGAELAARQAMKLQPKSFAARFLLGTSLRHQGKKIKSEFHLRRALDLASNDRERGLARKAMGYVQRTRDWDAKLTLGIAPTSNVGKKSDSEYLGVSVPGLFNNIPNQEKTESDRGVFYGLSVTRNIKLDNSALKFTLGQVRRDYSDDDYDSKSTTLSGLWIGANVKGRQNYVRVDRTWADFFGERYSTNTAVTVGQSFRSVGNRSGSISLTRNTESLAQNDTVNKTTSLVLKHDITKGRHYSISGQVSIADKTSTNQYNLSTAVDIGISAVYNPKGTGWVLNGSLTRGFEKWDNRNPFFVTDRRDKEWVARVGAQNRNFSLFGLTPTLSLTHQNRESTVDLYDLKSSDYFLGVTNAF